MPTPVENHRIHRREQPAARAQTIDWRDEIPSGFNLQEPRQRPGRLPVPTAMLLIIVMSLLLWSIFGAGMAWLMGWL